MTDEISIAFNLGCPAAAHNVSGLVALFWSLAGDGSGHDLEVVCHSRPGDFTAPVRFSAQRVESDRWFGLHTHLLPNGDVDVIVRLLKGDEVLAERSQHITVKNVGDLAERVRASLGRSAAPLIVESGCGSKHYNYDDADAMPWFDRPDALDTIAKWRADSRITEQEAGYLSDFVNKGFIVLEDFIDADLVAQINGEIDDAIARGFQGYKYGESTRIEKLHEHYPGVRELWLHDGVMKLIRTLYQSEPRPCQTLTYVFGSQQDAHQDTIHLTPFPAGYMCGVWVALEDVRPDSGELEVYVGSHRVPRVRMHDAGLEKVNGDWKPFIETVIPLWQRFIHEGGFEIVRYRPKKGAVLIWHENLMHAGSVRRDKSLSRRSVVSHVFANGSIAYYDSSGHVGHMEPFERMVKELPVSGE